MKRIVVAIAMCVVLGCNGSVTENGPKGPTISLLYDVPSQSGDPIDLDALASAIRRRITLAGIDSAWVRIYGPREIEVLVPASRPDVAKRVERLLDRPGTLEFRVVADRNADAKIVERAEKEKAEKLLDESGELLAWWVPVASNQTEAVGKDDAFVTRVRENGEPGGVEVLVIKDEYDVTGDRLRNVFSSTDASGRPCIVFAFNHHGGRLLEALTSLHRPQTGKRPSYRRLGIILDGKLYSAPRIENTIREYGRITGNFTKEEVDDIVDVLNAGSLPVRIKRVQTAKPARP